MLNATRLKSDWVQVSKNLDTCREARRNVDTFSSVRDLSSLTFSCIPLLALIAAHTQLWQVFCTY